MSKFHSVADYVSVMLRAALSEVQPDLAKCVGKICLNN